MQTFVVASSGNPSHTLFRRCVEEDRHRVGGRHGYLQPRRAISGFDIAPVQDDALLAAPAAASTLSLVRPLRRRRRRGAADEILADPARTELILRYAGPPARMRYLQALSKGALAAPWETDHDYEAR